jgi:hypothetical protein
MGCCENPSDETGKRRNQRWQSGWGAMERLFRIVSEDVAQAMPEPSVAYPPQDGDSIRQM